MKTKSCSLARCEQKNPQNIDQFTKDSNKPDGLSSHCRNCKNAWSYAFEEKMRKEREEFKLNILTNGVPIKVEVKVPYSSCCGEELTNLSHMAKFYTCPLCNTTCDADYRIEFRKPVKSIL